MSVSQPLSVMTNTRVPWTEAKSLPDDCLGGLGVLGRSGLTDYQLRRDLKVCCSVRQHRDKAAGENRCPRCGHLGHYDRLLGQC